jgi:hypothetical protein
MSARIWIITGAFMITAGCELVGGIVERGGSQPDAGAGAAGSAGTAGAAGTAGIAGASGASAGSGGATDASPDGAGGQGSSIDSLTVEGNAALEIAQGATATLVLSARMDGVASVVVDGSLVCTITSQTATELRCGLTVPHGASLGQGDAPRAADVSVFGQNGEVSGSPKQLWLTPIHVSPSGNDANSGAPSSPFRTLAFALVANGGAAQRDVIVLGGGTYSAATGETWPVYLPPGVNVKGSGNVSLLGTSTLSFVEQTVAGPLSTLPTRISNLELIGFGTAVSFTGSGWLLLEDVQIASAFKGVYLGGTTQATVRGTAPGKCAISGSEKEGLGTVGSAVVSIESCEFFDNAWNGLRVTAGSKVTMKGGTIYGNGLGASGFSGDRSNVYVKEQATLAVSGTPSTPVEIKDAYTSGCGVWIQYATAAVVVSLEFVHIHDNGACGIYHHGGNLTLTDALLENHPGQGIAVYDNGTKNTTKLRRTTIRTSGSAGIYFDALDTTLDLGTSGDPGQVHFQDNLQSVTNYANTAQLLHGTTDATSGPVFAVGTSFEWSSGGGKVTPTGLASGPDTLIVAGKPHWRIVNANHTIDFGP